MNWTLRDLRAVCFIAVSIGYWLGLVVWLVLGVWLEIFTFVSIWMASTAISFIVVIIRQARLVRARALADTL